MAERLTFLLGKDPETNFGGDMTMFRTMRAIAERRFDTQVICLSDGSLPSGQSIVRVPKPALSWPKLIRRTVTTGRSALHSRFDVDAMRDAIEQSTSDRFVAVHCHLAEPFLRSSRRGERDLLISTEVLESAIWPRMYGLPGAVEARRIRRDELRVVAAARAVGGYDRGEMDGLRAHGHDARWLPMTLPPAKAVDVAANPPRLVMLGHRGWRPNAEAARTIVRLWPSISAGIPDAELWLVGTLPDKPMTDLPPGVSDLGFVDDVDSVLDVSRALTAPVGIGGGVRVKLLEAAARGLPAVCTTEAVGSIEALLGLTAAPDDAAFVAHCRELLIDADQAAAEGARLHAANVRHHDAGHDAVLDWLSA
ncbi:MAG TPA: glycosyltransferase family 4 protein [Aeromicrobium sp.]|nr:glycosyltransferase family 4 protein [Aeromicrobium sp.]